MAGKIHKFIDLRSCLQVEDARAAMLIYQKHKKAWEKHMKRQLKLKKKMKDGRRRNRKKKESTNPDP